jgi:hypothetical protein
MAAPWPSPRRLVLRSTRALISRSFSDPRRPRAVPGCHGTFLLLAMLARSGARTARSSREWSSMAAAESIPAAFQLVDLLPSLSNVVGSAMDSGRQAEHRDGCGELGAGHGSGRRRYRCLPERSKELLPNLHYTPYVFIKNPLIGSRFVIAIRIFSFTPLRDPNICIYPAK